MPRWSFLVATTFGFGLFLAMVGSFLFAERDPKLCAMSYSRPIYIHQQGLDASWSRLAGKYGLYLYREGGIDVSDTVERESQPVLFIPGHAGSYKQSRSIASETTVQFDQLLKTHGRLYQRTKLDFFTYNNYVAGMAVDYNEELSAIHGPTLLAQAEYTNDAIRYILSLYSPSTSIIIVGHSMGGFIARVLPTIPSFNDNRLSTIITLSTPHSTPPAPVDSTMVRLYRDVNRFWRQETLDGVLKDVAVLSIAGGNLDNIVASDASSLYGIIPSSHGFTVYSTGIPHVWTGADHMAILWCNQLVQKVAAAIIKMVDSKNPSIIKPVHTRLSILKRIFLSQLDDKQSRYVLGSTVDLDAASAEILDTQHAYIHFYGAGQPVNMPLVLNAHPQPDTDFQLVTTLQAENGLKVSVCKHQDGSSQISCKSVTSNTAPLPPPANSTSQVLTTLRIDNQYLADAEFIVVDVRNQPTEGFINVEFQSPSEMVEQLNYTLLDLLLYEQRFEFPQMEAGTVHMPNINNPLFRYKLRITHPTHQDCSSDMTPIIRMSTNNQYESKYFVDTWHDIDIAFHGESAFTAGQQLGVHDGGLQLQIWNRPSCPVQASLRVDVFSSLGRVLLQHGIALAVLPFAFATLVFFSQTSAAHVKQVVPSWTCVAQTLYVRFLILGSTIFVGTSFVYNQNGNNAQTLAAWLTEITMFKDLGVMGLGVTGKHAWWPSLILPMASIGLLSFVVLVLHLTVWTMSITLKSMQGQSVAQPPLPPADRMKSIMRWTICTLTLSTLVLPQVLFMVLFLAQIFFCAETLTASTLENRYRFQFSVLVMMFCLVPYHGPASLVWVQNLVRGWYERPRFDSIPQGFQLATVSAFLTQLRSGGMTFPKMAPVNGVLVAVYCFAFAIGSAYTVQWIATAIWLLCLLQTKTKRE